MGRNIIRTWVGRFGIRVTVTAAAIGISVVFIGVGIWGFVGVVGVGICVGVVAGVTVGVVGCVVAIVVVIAPEAGASSFYLVWLLLLDCQWWSC